MSYITGENKNLNANDIKRILGHYFRFKKGFIGCVTECDLDEKEDFITFKKDEIVCCEVKVSKSDFVVDFKTKRKWKEQVSYNKIYFAVPYSLKDFALNKINDLIENNKIYRQCNSILNEDCDTERRFYHNVEEVGLLAISGINHIEVAKRAKLLNEKKIIMTLSRNAEKILKRMYSEYWNLRGKQ